MIWRIPHHGWKITTWNSQQDWAAVHLQGYREIFWFPSSTQITPSGSACNLGVVLDNQLSFTYLSNLTRSCRLLLYIIRRIWPFFSREITHMYFHLLVISIGILHFTPGSTSPACHKTPATQPEGRHMICFQFPQVLPKLTPLPSTVFL